MNRHLILVVLLSCAHPLGPSRAAVAYAEALEAGRLEQAWAASSGLSREAFERRYAEPGLRAARAAAVRGALWGQGEGVALQVAGERWRVVEAAEAGAVDGPTQSLARFLASVDAADWSAAWNQLSAAWRGRYSPERLGQDFAAEPLVCDRLSRAKAAGKGEPTVDSGRASFPIADGKAVRLVLEAGDWKIDALE